MGQSPVPQLKRVKIKCTQGQTVDVIGDKIGPFLVHNAIAGASYDGKDLYQHTVSHIASGFRFPWLFKTVRSAIAFAKAVEPIHDWAKIKVNLKSEWIAGKPDAEQVKAIFAAAKKNKGFVP